MVEPIVLLTLLIVWTAVYVASRFLPFDKYGLEFTPIYMLYRTEKFNEFLSRIAGKKQRLWRTFANIGVAVAAVEMSLAVYFLAMNLQRFLYVPKEAEPIILVLPGVTIDLRWFPYILIAATLTITIHEMAHGVLCFSEKIPVKSSGIIIAPITFGGFVEPDEEVFDQSPLPSKLRVLAAGSLTNITAGLAIMLLFSALFAPSSGVLVMTTPEGGPAYTAGMRPWEVIYSIDGHRVQNTSDLAQFMAAIGPGVPLKVETSQDIRNIVTSAALENGSRGILGIREFLDYYPMRVGEIHPQLSYHLYWTLSWTSMLMINVAIFNMLPLFPFDGEACVYSLLKEKLKKGLKGSRIAINALSLLLLASNVGLTFIKGLTPL